MTGFQLSTEGIVSEWDGMAAQRGLEPRPPPRRIFSGPLLPPAWNLSFCKPTLWQVPSAAAAQISGGQRHRISYFVPLACFAMSLVTAASSEPRGFCSCTGCLPSLEPPGASQNSHFTAWSLDSYKATLWRIPATLVANADIGCKDL